MREKSSKRTRERMENCACEGEAGGFYIAGRDRLGWDRFVTGQSDRRVGCRRFVAVVADRIG